VPLGCYKHLPGQSASIIIAFEFFGMFVSTRTPSVFLGGSESCTYFRNNIPFFRPSSCFVWSDDFDNQQHFVLNSLWLINSLPLMGRYFCKQISSFWLDNRDVQERNEVRWRPGKERSLAPPCANLRSFGSKCRPTVLKKVVTTLLWLFAPCSDSAPAKLFPLDLSLRLWCYAIKIGKFSENKQIFNSERH